MSPTVIGRRIEEPGQSGRGGKEARERACCPKSSSVGGHRGNVGRASRERRDETKGEVLEPPFNPSPTESDGLLALVACGHLRSEMRGRWSVRIIGMWAGYTLISQISGEQVWASQLLNCCDPLLPT